MKPRKDLLLNSSFLKNRVAELGLKQWWLAEQVGVDRKTVLRWLQGQVKSIQAENVEALRRVLNCQESDLCLENAADHLASHEDQKHAAQLLAQSSLINKLGPLGEWDVIESLLKATIVPGLPLNILGDLFNQLTVASWRQNKIDQADLYNKKALEIARKCQDKAVLAQAKLSQANIFSWRGKVRRAIETYQEIIGLKDFIEAKTLGATYSNLGAVLHESGDSLRGEDFQKKAIDLFYISGAPMNHSIAQTNLVLIYLKLGDLLAAQSACDKSIQFAQADGFKRGLLIGELLQSEIWAHQELKERALAHMQTSLGGFSAAGIEEGLNYEIAGRICRLVGQISESKTLLEKGIQMAQEFPIYQAALHFELAQTLLSLGEPFIPAAQKALAIYGDCESPLQVEAVKAFLESAT